MHRMLGLPVTHRGDVVARLAIHLPEGQPHALGRVRQEHAATQIGEVDEHNHDDVAEVDDDESDEEVAGDMMVVEW